MERAEYVDSLRKIADFFEGHPEIEIPSLHTSLAYPNTSADDPKQVAKIIKAVGGKFRKEIPWPNSDTITYAGKIGAFDFRIICSRAAMCRRVVVGTKEIPAQEVPAQTIPAYTEEIVEWHCDEPILKRTTEE